MSDGHDLQPVHLRLRGNAVVSAAQLSHADFWRKYDAVETRLATPLTERMLELAELRPGQRLLDLASGRGEPAIPAAHRLGPSGEVVGIDVADPILEIAREKAAAEKLSNIRFHTGNAETQENIPPDYFHAATARWGLMYMNDPAAALAATYRALRAGGVFVAALWAEPELVDYFSLPRKLFAKYLDLPPIDPEAPGIFRFGTAAQIQRDFTAAGFTVEKLEDLYVPVIETELLDDLVLWVRSIGNSKLLAQLSDADQQAWEQDLRTTLEAQRDQHGLMRLGGVTRIAVARK